MKPRATALLALSAIFLAAGGQLAASPASGRTVTLRNIAFAPKSLSISRNASVTFRWRDDGTAHNVTSIGRKRFTSIADRATGAKSVRFTAKGTYRYTCTLHPGMNGRITVK